MISWLLPLGILIFFEFVADIFSKNWSMKGGFWLAFAGLASYMLANTFWLFALKNGSGLGRGAMIFSLVSAVVAILLGICVYQEKITTPQMFGIGLGLIALILMFWE